MYKEVLRAMEGIDGYYLVSLILFMTIFIGVVIWAFKADNSYISKMSSLPLENSNEAGLKKGINRS
jgi:cbb3-type cytochrome oxidase subunit 3